MPCCLRRVLRFMGLHLFTLVWPLRLNLPVGFPSTVVFQHQLVRCSGTTVTKPSSHFTGNNIEKAKEQMFPSFSKSPPFTVQWVLWQQTGPTTLSNMLLKSDCLFSLVHKQFGECQLYPTVPQNAVEVSSCASTGYTASTNLGRLVLPWDTSN